MLCDRLIKIFLSVCKSICFPIAFEKTEWRSTCVVFLGLLLDTVRQLVCIPREKIERALTSIHEITRKKKVTCKSLQQLCGYLNFLCRCIVPGRAFTRHLYSSTCDKQKVLQPHHHVRVNAEIRLHLEMWKTFLNDATAYSRPFIDFKSYIDATQIRFYTDASGCKTLGMGGICDHSWMVQMWDTSFITKFKPSIEFLELYVLMAAVLQWIYRFKNNRVILFCDNISVMQMINKTTSSCKHCMNLIRIVVLESLNQNVRIYAKYVSSKDNAISDSLSRNQMARFIKLTKDLKMDENPTPVPSIIWPMHKVWCEF